MIKSKEYLKSRFENGDYPTGEDYENLLDSFWHKSELGQVTEGEERPVSGVAVAAAMKEAVREALAATSIALSLCLLCAFFVAFFNILKINSV